jgi:hypothetical protein
MLRLLACGLLAAGLLAAPALAQAPPETRTIVSKGEVSNVIIEWGFTSPDGGVPPLCDLGPGPAGPLYLLRTVTSSVTHVTDFEPQGDGKIIVSSSQRGTFTAAPLEDPSLPSYTGSFTGTTSGTFDGQGSGHGTATQNMRGVSSDGVHFSFHLNNHFSQTDGPNGEFHFFEHCH